MKNELILLMKVWRLKRKILVPQEIRDRSGRREPNLPSDYDASYETTKEFKSFVKLPLQKPQVPKKKVI